MHFSGGRWTVTTRLAYVLCCLVALLLPLGFTSTARADFAPDDKIAVIGDSLTDQRGAGQTRITDALHNRGHGYGGIYFWGVGGKRLVDPDSEGTTTLQNIRAARTELGHVDTWIIALGTNDRFSAKAEIRAGVDKILAALGSDRFVWIGLGFHDGDSRYSKRVNAILQNAIAAEPNGRYADWNSYIHDPSRDAVDLWTYPHDNLHMTEKGYRIRSRFYARSVT